jgi:hypothetical protein
MPLNSMPEKALSRTESFATDLCCKPGEMQRSSTGGRISLMGDPYFEADDISNMELCNDKY